jgi:ABC-type Zn uptake system ZnuABC Zn-binding protein ZnuA
MKAYANWLQVILVLLAFAAGGCQSKVTPAPERAEHERGVPELSAVTLGEGEKLQVVATTNIVGDVVNNVGGDRIELTTLMRVGIDPHSYVPTPSDTAAIHDAHVVFANGVGLEENLEEMLESAGGDAVEVYVSHELELREAQEGYEREQEGHPHEGADPHVWFDVKNVIHWVETIEHTLSALDPANAQVYEANAEAYVHELEELDAWIMGQVTTIPEANRRLVTNHPVFAYFAARYGLEQLGAVYPVSPSSEPSAQDIAELERAIREVGVPAVFAERTVNSKLAEQVAQDTGVELVPLYTGSVGEPGSGVESYIELMRYDVNAIVDALK